MDIYIRRDRYTYMHTYNYINFFCFLAVHFFIVIVTAPPEIGTLKAEQRLVLLSSVTQHPS